MQRHILLLLVMSEAIPLLLLAVFFRVERTMRQGLEAQSLAAKEEDRGSTRYLGLALGLCLLSILVAPALNYFGIAYIGKISFLIAGGSAMIAGLALRITAALTLGKFYTRTLTRLSDHKLLTHGIYRYVRNPGYLGTLLLFIGAGIASNNYISMAVCILLPILAYLYRIHAEETMLRESFGEEFISYKKRSWRLIPFIY